MTTTVILEGVMGKALGREWTFQNVRSCRHALAMVEVNTGKAKRWIRENLQKYANYRVVCEYEDGRKEELVTQEFSDMTQGGVKTMRFVPVISGASAVARVVVGVVMMVASFWCGPFAANVFAMGAALALGGVAELLAPKPKTASEAQEEGKSSYYFNGAVNVTAQGSPVQLIYGRCLVGSQAISASMTVDQLL